MNPDNGGGESSVKLLGRQGLCGIYSASPQPQMLPTRLDALTSTLDTTLHQHTKVEPNFLVATTGSIHAMANGGTVILLGDPKFRNTELADTSRAAGFAAAVARGYEKYSQNVFQHIFNPFACVIIDPPAKRVLLAVDRMGQQTMYYRAEADVVYFGSAASGILPTLGTDATLLNQGIYNYLYFHMVPSPGSVYRDIQKLPGAHYLDYQDGQATLVNYWRPSFSESTKLRSFSDAARRLKDLLRTSVENCIPDTGKTGAFLSGGLDSSTVAGFLAESGAKDAEVFSIGFSADGYDEMAFARITARHFGIKHNEYYVTPQDVVDALPMIANSYDEPFGNSSALPAYFCAKMASEHGVDTLLAGDGGDEIFGGNERYVKQRIFEYYGRIPGILRSGLIEPIIQHLPTGLPLIPKVRSYVAQANTPLPDRLQSYNFLHRHAAADIFQDDVLADIDVELPLNLLRSIYHRPDRATDLNRMLYLDWQITLADNDLRKVSHMCAIAGVGVAYPMLADELVEFSCEVPSTWKIKNRDLRYFYKQALSGWLPRETITKTKQGFGLPFGVWMQTYKPLREMAYDNLLKLKSRGFIRPEFIDRAIAMHQSEHAAYYGELVWILNVFELWLEGHRDV